MNADTEVWTRDASWWNHPNTTAPKKCHRQHDDPQFEGMAACSPGLIMLDTDARSQRAGDVYPRSLCGRCFPKGVQS